MRFPARGLKIPLAAGTPALVFDIRLHTDAPGADGLANEVDGDGYERTTITVAPFPVAGDSSLHADFMALPTSPHGAPMPAVRTGKQRNRPRL